MDCIPPGSSVHGIFQARILEWVTVPLSRTLIESFANIDWLTVLSSLGSNISSFKNLYNIVMVFGLICLQERKYFKIVFPNLSIHQ